MDTRKLLLTAAEIAALPGEKRIHFLNPNAVRINKSLGDAVGLHHIGVHLISVEPGRDTTEYHIHYYEEECVYVLSGTGKAIIGDDEYPLATGDFLGLPRNMVAHNIVNDGDETLVCLVMGQRLEQDVADYPRLGKRLYRHGGQWDVVDLADIGVAQRVHLPPDEESVSPGFAGDTDCSAAIVPAHRLTGCGVEPRPQQYPKLQLGLTRNKTSPPSSRARGRLRP